MDGETVGVSPIFDPNSDKYPDRIFRSGQWMTQEQIERRKKRQCERRCARRANDPEYAEKERARKRERRRRSKTLRSLALSLELGLLTRRIAALFQMATSESATKNERELALSALRKEGYQI